MSLDLTHITDFLKKIHFNSESIKEELRKVLHVMTTVVDVLTSVSQALDTFKTSHQGLIDEIKTDVQKLFDEISTLQNNGQDASEIQNLAQQINDKVNGLTDLSNNLKTVDSSIEQAQSAASSASAGDAGSSVNTGDAGSPVNTGDAGSPVNADNGTPNGTTSSDANLPA